MRLLGMTWDHARGHGPMAATASAYARAHPQVEIAWEKRSLQAFADQPLEDLAAGYDLLVIDHPHVGAAARRGCLLALDDLGRDAELRALARASLAGSHESYRYAGRQWALAIDAAAQVACYRPDLIAAPPTTWEQLLDLARAGRVLCPLKPVDALMTFFTLAANRGTPCRNDGRADAPLLPPDAGLDVLDTMRTLTQHLPAECLSMNPIETYERLGEPDHQRFACCPLGYGYSNYARAGFRARRLRFGDIPSFFPGAGPRGSTLGGTGIAVSSRSRHLETAVDYAFWIASADCQRGEYFDGGGQPAHAAAWSDERCNTVTLDFFRDTRRTMDQSWLRPRYDGYLAFQDEGGTILNDFLRGRRTDRQTIERLEAAYQKSLRS